MDQTDINDFLIEHFVEDNILQNLIEHEESLEKLCYYLRWKCKKIERNQASKFDFKISKILENRGLPFAKKEALIWALTVQSSNVEFIKCLEWFNIELKRFLNNGGTEEQVIELYCILDVLIEFEEIAATDILKYVCLYDLKTFILRLTKIKPNEEYCANIYDSLMKYLERIIAEEPYFMEEMLCYLIQNENMDFLCILLNRKLLKLAEDDLLQKNELWNLVEEYMVKENSIKKKQSLSILISTLEFLKVSNLPVPEILKSDSFEIWDLYFTLLDISKEKQLHLIKPTLKLLPLISSLHITWQLPLYKLLLNHSQNYVIYKTIEFLCHLNFEDNNIYRDLLRNILSALNKYESSDLSQSTHVKLSWFCNKMNGKWSNVFIEEFLDINWSPVAAWSILRSISPILHNIEYRHIKKMLRTLRNLPHPFIRYNCTFLFLERIFDELSEDLILVTVEVGKHLLSTEVEIDEEMFEKIIKLNEDKFETIKNELRDKTLKAINTNENTSYVYLKLLKILNIPMDIVPDKGAFCSQSIRDIHVMLNFDVLGPVEFTEYLLEKDRDFQSIDYKYLSKIPDKFLIENKTFSSEDYKKICSHYSNYLQQNDSGLEIISYKDIFMKLKSEKAAKQYLESLYIRNKWWMAIFKLSLRNMDVHRNIVIEDQFRAMLGTEDEKMFLLVVENLDILSEHFNAKKIPEVAYIYDECFRRICEMPNPSSRFYSEIFFKSTLHPKLFSDELLVGYLTKWCIDLRREYFSDCVAVLIVILKKIRELILLKVPNLYKFLSLSLTALLQVTVVQKTERIEHEICQDIQNLYGNVMSIRNPNILAMELKMLAFETLYLLSRNDSTMPDKIVNSLLELYQKNYGKRYFQESKVHLEKLRIVQALLLLANLINDSKNRLIRFILSSFCEETHQNSVKQLLQWLLIILMTSDSPEHMDFLIEKINSASLSQPSSVVYLIPVLYHLLLSSNNVEYWYKATDALLTWTMGANFKLRAYSQVTLARLLEMAETKNLTEYLSKYIFLLKPITKVLESTGNAAEDILKNDLAFIESFNPKLHYCIQNIFITLPRVDVPPSEWENIADYEFSSQFDVKIKNDADLSGFNKIYVKNVETEIDKAGMNIQKKIIPWKYALEECANNENLGDLIVVASLLEKPSNLGGLSRSCEVFSVKQFVLHNVKIKDDKEFKNLSMSSENWVNFLEVKRDDLSNFLTNMKQLGYSLIGLEQTFESVKLNEYKFERKTVLILGNEKEGIPATLLPLMDVCIEIPQFGQTRSLNVHVAAATCIWEYVHQFFLQ